MRTTLLRSVANLPIIMRKIPPPYTDPTPLFRHGGISGPRQDGLLDFSANINPLGPPASVLRVLREELPGIAHYPDPQCRELTQRLAAHHGVAPDQIVVGNGSNELIYAIARAFRPKRVAIAEPTYTEYLRASLSVGATVDHWLAEGENFDLEPFDPEGADIVWLCNPNNPTGGVWPGGRMMEWMEAFPQTLFVADEAFLPLTCPSLLDRSLLKALNRVSNLIVLRSFTKYFAMPGLRLGYAVADTAINNTITQLLREQVPFWSVNHLAQKAGLAALLDRDYLADTEEWLLSEHCPAGHPSFKDRLAACSDMLRPLPSQTSFFLVRLHGISAASLQMSLRKRGILIRNGFNFVGLDNHFIRVAVRSFRENQRLFSDLTALLQG